MRGEDNRACVKDKAPAPRYTPLMKGFGVYDLLECYARGVFPMADSRDDPRIFLLDPDERGIIPLDGLHISRSLRKTLARAPFDVQINTDFLGVVKMCASEAPGRDNTWINDGIINLYGQLHEVGHAHSVECYEGEDLIGGLYGVSLGGAFFGESMFSHRTDASKIALVHLVERLRARGFALLDTQFITDHLRRMGAVEISREQYHARLASAIEIEASFV